MSNTDESDALATVSPNATLNATFPTDNISSVPSLTESLRQSPIHLDDNSNFDPQAISPINQYNNTIQPSPQTQPHLSPTLALEESDLQGGQEENEKVDKTTTTVIETPEEIGKRAALVAQIQDLQQTITELDERIRSSMELHDELVKENQILIEYVDHVQSKICDVDFP